MCNGRVGGELMPRIWVSVGSNIDREVNVRAAIVALRDLFGDLTVSPLYEVPAVGFDGEPFFNLVVGFYSELPPRVLHGLMRTIEARQGRERSTGSYASRTLDLDVLTYGDQITDEGGKALPRDDILRYHFVLAPLADVAAGERHPAIGRRYDELWAERAAEFAASLRRLDRPDWL